MPVPADDDLAEPAGVFENETALAVRRVVAVQIEEALVAFVRQCVEVFQITRPAGKARLQPFAGRQVAHRPVNLAHVDVVQLIAAFIVSNQDAVVVGKVTHGGNRVGRRVSELRRWTALDRLAVGVEDAARVGAN